MRRIALTLALLLATFDVSLTQSPLQIQTLPVSEVSGAVNIGNGRVMLIADEGYQVQIVSNAEQRFGAGDPQGFSGNMKSPSPSMSGGKEIVDDIEDVAWDDKKQVAFLITSHSRSKKQDDVADPKADKPQRHKLARINLKAGDFDASHKEIDALEESLKEFSFVSEAMKRPHQAGGNSGTFNIEGLAFDKKSGHLLIGLRSPTQLHDGKPCAVVLTLKNPHALFDKKPSLPNFKMQPTYLDLGGLGIRGMTYDARRKGFWIVAGRSDDPDTPTNQVPSTLWFWDSTKHDKSPRKVEIDLRGLDNLEGVCLLERDGKPGLLLINDDGGGNSGSRYLWTPIPEASSK